MYLGLLLVYEQSLLLVALLVSQFVKEREGALKDFKARCDEKENDKYQIVRGGYDFQQKQECNCEFCCRCYPSPCLFAPPFFYYY